MTDNDVDVAGSLAAVRHRIAAAAGAAGRDPAEIELVAVSKTHGIDRIRAAMAAGQRVFGENRVQEAARKYPPLRQSMPDFRLHLIGPLQTNKALEAVRIFDVVESLDRVRLAEALAAAMTKTGRRPDCFIQINIGGEPQKSGVSPDETGALIADCRRLELPVVGLMCIPPVDRPPAQHFIALRELAVRHGLSRLSMGMSGDFEDAIRCGATSVRIGTAIFGRREVD